MSPKWIALALLAACGDPTYAPYDPGVDVVLLVKPTLEGSCYYYTHGPTADEAARALVDDGFTVYAAASCVWVDICTSCSCGDRMVAVEVRADSQQALQDEGWYTTDQIPNTCASACVGPSDEDPRGYVVIECPWHAVD